MNLVTVLWGSQHAIIKLALDDTSSDTSPAELNLARFILAGRRHCSLQLMRFSLCLATSSPDWVANLVVHRYLLCSQLTSPQPFHASLIPVTTLHFSRFSLPPCLVVAYSQPASSYQQL